MFFPSPGVIITFQPEIFKSHVVQAQPELDCCSDTKKFQWALSGPGNTFRQLRAPNNDAALY
jgi:hypothetical protein